VPKSHSADDVFRALRKHDPGFEVQVRRGKGSHRLIFHRQTGRQFVVPYHKGRDLAETIPQDYHPPLRFAEGFLRLRRDGIWKFGR
jgi:predicted RNA binding protein YcfA (HicA-like mRNA interferase family)